MTAKAVTISSDSFRPSYFARNLYPTTNPLRSFTVLSVKKRVYVIISLIVAAVAAFLAFTQVFGEGGSSDSGNNSSGNTSSSDQQSSKGQSSRSSPSSSNTSPNESTGSSSNSNSTSVTVNGQSVAVPQSGSYDQNVSVPGGNVHISGNSSQSSTGNSSSNNTTTNVEINSE